MYVVSQTFFAPIVVSLSLLALSATAYAQNTITQEDTTFSLEEVTVTARKRQTSLQEAAIAVSALSGDTLAQANLTRLDDFNGFVPGLTIAKNDGAGRVVAIRGVGWETAQNLSTQPSVLLYVDGVYVANPLAIGADIGDIERVEVFRGPQGTEFGQGTTGGALNLVLKKPSTDSLGGSVSLGLGSFDTTKVNAALNVPLSDTVAVRGSVQRFEHDGYAEIEGGVLDGFELDDADSLTAKLALQWDPTERFSVYLSALYTDSDNNGAAQKNVDDPIADARRLTQDFPSEFALENTLLSAKLSWQLSDSITANFSAGYQDLEKDQTVDGDRLTEDTFNLNLFGFSFNNFDVLPFFDNESEAVSVEFNLLGKTDKLDWVAGLYYLDHENFNSFLEAGGPAPFSQFADAIANPSAETLPPFNSVLIFNEDRTVTREDLAVYGQFTYRFNDRYAFTAGARYQDEDQLDESLQFFFIEAIQELNDSAFTWKLGLDVNLTDNNLLYGLISTGWKNGGTNPGALNGAQQVPTEFEAAEVTSFEIGSKNTFAGGRGRVNVVGFYNQFDNLQFTQEDPTPFAGGTGNIPETEIVGIESEFSWAFNQNWQINGQVTWQDGEFQEDFFTLDVIDFREALVPFDVGLFTENGAAVRSQLGFNTNLNGNTPPKLVDLSARIGLTNISEVGSGTLTSSIDLIYRGEFEARVFNNPLVDTVPSYELVNLSFLYEPVDSKFQFSLNASNLFDEDGVNAIFSNPFGGLTTSEEFIPPRTVIGSVRYSF